MACLVNRKDLSPEDIKTIQSKLTLQPMARKTFKKPGQKTMPNSKQPIMFFMSDKTTVSLPHYFASALTGKVSNDELKYPEVEIEFTQKLREGQVAIMNQVKKDLDTQNTTVICAPTGYGKTAMGCYAASMCGLLTVVLCPMSVLMQQWKKSFEKFTNAKTWIIGEEDMPKEVNVVICLLDRVYKLSSEFRKQVGLLIVDEAHLFCTTEGVPALLGFTPKYIVAETATPNREDSMKTMLQALCGVNFIEPEYFKKNGKAYMKIAGHVSEVKQFKVVKVNTGVTVEGKTNKMGRLDWTALVDDLSKSDQRDQCMIDIVNKHKDSKIMILVFRKDHVERLLEKFEDMDEKVQAVYGKKTSYTNCRILIGTNSKMGTGFDEENACFEFDGKKADILIMSCSFRSELALTQAAGRIFRADAPLIYHFVDNVGTIKSHWYVAKKFYDSRGATFEVLDM